jgi:hypothetical protein
VEEHSTTRSWSTGEKSTKLNKLYECNTGASCRWNSPGASSYWDFESDCGEGSGTSSTDGNSSSSVVTGGIDCTGVPEYSAAVGAGGVYQWSINNGQSVVYNNKKYTANTWYDIGSTTPDAAGLPLIGVCN